MKLGSISGRSAGLFVTSLLAGLGSSLAAGMKTMVEHAALKKSERRTSTHRHRSVEGKTYGSRSRYMPHQGEREMARRRRHIAEGRLSVTFAPK